MRAKLTMVAVFASLMWGRSGASAQELSLFGIHLQNQVDAAAVALSSAAPRLEAIYRAVGLRAVWVETPLAGNGDAFGVMVVLTTARLSKQGAEQNVLGVAPESAARCGRVAYVFWDRVADYAVGRRQDVAVVLAMVIAHEIGHLLLPAGSHTMVGVMRAEWRDDDFAYAKSGRLGFSKAEGARMRERIHIEERMIANAKPRRP